MHMFDALRLLNLLASLAMLAIVVSARPRFAAQGLERVQPPLVTGTALLLLNALFGLASWEQDAGGTMAQLKSIWLPFGTRISFLLALVWWLRAPRPEAQSSSRLP